MWAVDHDDRAVGACRQAVDANLVQAGAEGVDQAGGQVGCNWPGELGAVTQETKGQFEGVLAPDPDRQAPAALRLQEHDDMVVLAS